MAAEQRTGIHGAVACPSSDNSMDLIDEQHNLAVGVGDLFDDSLEAVLKLSPVLGARDQGPHVKRHQEAVLQCPVTGEDGGRAAINVV